MEDPALPLSLDATKYVAAARLSVLSSTSISQRVSAVTSRLLPDTADSDSGNVSPLPIVALHGRARVASKLVTIVEIARRDLAARGVACFQYTVLGAEMVDMIQKREKRGVDDEIEGDDDHDEAEAFETMPGAEIEPVASEAIATKKRNIPTLTVYLATASVKELAAAYGEQT